MSFLHTLANPLSQDQKQSVAKKFRDILDDMTTPLLLAIQYAHTYGNPPVKREEIWKNLFVPPKKELLDPTRYSPSKPPANIYQDWDIQLVLKYLYFGGQRITSFSPVKRYAQDQECYFDFFRIEHRYLALKPPADDPVGLFAGDYSRALFQAITLRNTTYHNTQSNVEEFTVAGCAAFVEHLSVLLRPLCGAVSWDQTGMEQAQKLLKKMWPGVCNAMGEVSYPIAGILEYLRIPSTEQTVAEQMLMDAGFTVNQGYLAVCGDVDELAYGLLYAWKVGQQIGKEYGVELLSQCRERLLAWLTPNQEEKVQEQKDWETMPLDALEALAKKDHVEAQYHLACRLLHGEGKADLAFAFYYLRRSANLGYPPAQVQMGMHLENGTRKQGRDWKEAFAWYKKAADQNDPVGLYNLGRCYAERRGVQQNYGEAILYLLQAQERGSIDAKVGLATLQLHGHGMAKNEGAAIKILRELAQEECAPALARLGLCYYEGVGVAKNTLLCFQYFQRAAKAGNTNALYRMGWCYEYGIGTEKNIATAWQWYMRAARKGHCSAQLKCANRAKLGYRWIKELAAQNYAPAQTRLGSLYLLTEDKVEAGVALLQAAKDHSVEAKRRLAECYLYGQGVHSDQQQARILARQVIKQGGWYDRMCAEGMLAKSYQIAEDKQWLYWADQAAYSGHVRWAIELVKFYTPSHWGRSGSRYTPVADEGYDLQKALTYFGLAAKYGNSSLARAMADFCSGQSAYLPPQQCLGTLGRCQGDYILNPTGFQEPAKAQYWYEVQEQRENREDCQWRHWDYL